MQSSLNFAPRLCAALLALTLAGAVSAHPLLAAPTAEAGSFYKAAIGITHGCSGSATREVIVMIPPGVEGAKPMVKAGAEKYMADKKMTRRAASDCNS